MVNMINHHHHHNPNHHHTNIKRTRQGLATPKRYRPDWIWRSSREEGRLSYFCLEKEREEGSYKWSCEWFKLVLRLSADVMVNVIQKYTPAEFQHRADLQRKFMISLWSKESIIRCESLQGWHTSDSRSKEQGLSCFLIRINTSGCSSCRLLSC